MFFFRLMDLASETMIPILTGISTIFLIIHQHEIMIRNYEQDQRIAEDQREQDRRIRQLDREEDLKIIELQRQQDLQNDELRRQFDREIAENERETRRNIEQQYRDLLEEYRRKDVEIISKNRIEDQQRQRERQLELSIMEYIDDILALVFEYGLPNVYASQDILLAIRTRTQMIMRSLDPSRRLFLFQLILDSPINLRITKGPSVGILSSCDLRGIHLGTSIPNGVQSSLIIEGDFNMSRSDFHNSSFQHLFISQKKIDFTETNLNDVVWLNVEISEAEINNTHMSGVKFYQSILKYVKFRKTRLSGAVFRLISPGVGIRFYSLPMDSVDLSMNSWLNFGMSQVSLTQSNLSSCRFFDGLLQLANMRKVDISNSNFTKISFLDVALYECQMHNTKFINSSFTRSNLTGCSGFQMANTRFTRFIQSTLPNGTWIRQLCSNCP